MTQEDIVTLSMIKEAKAGNVAAYRALIENMYGKAPQAMELTGEDGGPIRTEVQARTWYLVDHSGGVSIPEPDEV